MDIAKWKELSLRLKGLRAEEADLRREICTEIIADTEMKNGIVTVRDSIQGYDVTAKQALGYTIDVAVLGTIWDELSTIESDCIVMKPTLSLGAYKKLPDSSLLHEAIISKLAMPTLNAEERGE